MDQITGPTGPTGSTGYQGLTGPTGYTGPQVPSNIGHEKNFVNPILLWIWSAATLGVIITFGAVYHAKLWMWIMGAVIWLTGDGYEGYQLRTDGETTLGPYAIQFVAAAAIGLAAATQ